MDKTMIKNNPNISHQSTSYIIWGAIIAGVMVGLAVESLFALLFLGLGLISFIDGVEISTTISISSIIWLVMYGIISMGIAGWVVGRLSGIASKVIGAIHGIIVWALTTLFTILLIANIVGTIISGTISTAKDALFLSGQNALSAGKTAVQIGPQLMQKVKNILPDVNTAINDAKQKLGQALDNFKKNTDQVADETKNQLRENLTMLLTSDIENARYKARQKIVELLIQNTNMSEEQIDKNINDWQQKYAQMDRQVKQQIAEVKQKTIAGSVQIANVLGSSALTAFFILLLSAIASAFGGAYGARQQRFFDV